MIGFNHTLGSIPEGGTVFFPLSPGYTIHCDGINSSERVDGFLRTARPSVNTSGTKMSMISESSVVSLGVPRTTATVSLPGLFAVPLSILPSASISHLPAPNRLLNLCMCAHKMMKPSLGTLMPCKSVDKGVPLSGQRTNLISSVMNFPAHSRKRSSVYLYLQPPGDMSGSATSVMMTFSKSQNSDVGLVEGADVKPSSGVLGGLVGLVVLGPDGALVGLEVGRIGGGMTIFSINISLYIYDLQMTPFSSGVFP
mmetsp:Transcript_14684/g.27591  ORF Transcript_14684/g.27591 Transcript_14684/m.27591 type:complete len:254 (-) Transcript_14684:1150-1911(-)